MDDYLALACRPSTQIFPQSAALVMTPKPSTAELLSLDAVALQRRLEARLLTSLELVQACLTHISKHDQQGARLGAMISLVPRHLQIEQSERLDAERSAGRLRGPLHGIPILVKV